MQASWSLTAPVHNRQCPPHASSIVTWTSCSLPSHCTVVLHCYMNKCFKSPLPKLPWVNSKFSPFVSRVYPQTLFHSFRCQLPGRMTPFCVKKKKKSCNGFLAPKSQPTWKSTWFFEFNPPNVNSHAMHWSLLSDPKAKMERHSKINPGLALYIRLLLSRQGLMKL